MSGEVEAAPEATAESTETVQETAPTEKAKAEEVKEAIRKHKLKVNGQEREYDEKTVIAMAQKGLASDEKFRKAASESKRISEIIQKAKENPDLLLKELIGMDPVEYSKKRLARELEELSLDPKEKELRKLKAELEEMKRFKEETTEKEKKLSVEKMTQVYIKKFDEEIPSALKKAGLPVNSQTIKSAVNIMLENLQDEDGELPPMDIVMDLVKDEFTGGVKKFLTSSDKEHLIEFLGEDLVDELLKAKAKKKPGPKPKQAIQDGSDPGQKRAKEFSSPEELEEYVRNWSKS